MTSIYGILDTEINQFVTVASGKVAWPTARAAKSAYTCHMGPSWCHKERPRFDEQTRYVIVDLTEAYFRLEGLMQ
jgi:hypothetical protein